jgi:hypothetical protein
MRFFLQSSSSLAAIFATLILPLSAAEPMPLGIKLKTSSLEAGAKHFNGTNLSVQNLAISDDGQHYAAWVPKGSRFVLRLDDKEMPTEYDYVGAFAIPGQPHITNIMISAQGQHVAGIAARDGKHYLIVDAKEFSISDYSESRRGREVYTATLQFSPDGSRWAALLDAGIEEGNHYLQRILIDGELGPPIYGNPLTSDLKRNTVVFSEDGKHYAYIGNNKNGAFVVHDGQIALRAKTLTDLKLTKNGLHYAVLGSNGVDWKLYIDAKAVSGEFPKLSHLQLSEDGSHHAYMTIGSRKGNDKTTNFGGMAAYVDGKLIKTRPNSQASAVVLSADGMRSATTVDDLSGKGLVYILIDGQPTKDYSQVIAGPFFSKDSKNVIIHFGSQQGEFIWVDGTETPVTQFKSLLTLDVNGPGYAFQHISDDSYSYAIINGTKGPRLAPSTPVFSFSNQSTSHAYTAEDEKGQVVVHNGKVIPMKGFGINWFYSLSTDRHSGMILLSPDGSNAVWSAASADQQPAVFLNGIPGPSMVRVAHPVFSPDGKHLAYLGWVGNAWTLYLDGSPLSQFEAIFLNNPRTLTFLPDGSLNLYAVKDQQLVRFAAPPSTNDLTRTWAANSQKRVQSSPVAPTGTALPAPAGLPSKSPSPASKLEELKNRLKKKIPIFN